MHLVPRRALRGHPPEPRAGARPRGLPAPGVPAPAARASRPRAGRLLALACALACATAGWGGRSAAQDAPPPAPAPAPAPVDDPPAAERPGFLGVAMAPWPLPGEDPAVAAVTVTGVVPGSAAERAGLRPGDVILAVEGRPVRFAPGEALGRFGALVRAYPVGAEVRLLVRRRTLSFRTYVDEEPLGPPRDASGPGAGDALPDVGALAQEHEGRLVSLRARLQGQEAEVTATLGERPDQTRRPLPPNEALRPDLAAAPLDPAAALTLRLLERARVDGAPLRAVYDEVRARLEQDEANDDPWRLRTVRFLKRDPLRLPGAARALARALEGALVASEGVPGSPSGLLGAIQASGQLLDASVGSVVSGAPLLPPPADLRARAGPQAALEAHARFVGDCLERAAELVGGALSSLEPDERAAVERDLPDLARLFATGRYVHDDEDLARRERNRRLLVDLLPRVERGGLLRALAALARMSDPAWLASVRADLAAAEAAGLGAQAPYTHGKVLHQAACKVGAIVFGSSEDNDYYGLDAAAVIDLGGDDVYRARLGAAGPGRPAAVLIDLGGDDRYLATEDVAHGAAFLGAALLVDLEGDDVYASSADFAQGAALCGAAALVDVAGDDHYRGRAYAQGAAFAQGLGLLLDLGGHDRHDAGVHAQGFGGPGAVGALLAQGGDDRYFAGGLVPCTYGEVGTFHAMSQGVGMGVRHLASGGVGVLLDRGGDDRYEAGNFAQGGGYFYAWGLLLDLGHGDDRYEGSRYSLGFAAHQALGSLLDAGGDDRYRGWVGAQASAAWDLCATVFLDDGGDDVHEPGPGFSVGASAHNGLSLFVDAGGRDRYGAEPARAGPNDYHGGRSLSVFLDLGADPDGGGTTDRYLQGGLEDGRARVAGEVGLAVDLPAPVDGVDDALLERLFGR